MGRDLDALRPPFLRASQPDLQDVFAGRWVDLEPYVAWGKRVEEAVSAAGSGRHRSGFKRPQADLIGALGAALYALHAGEDPQVIIDRRGDGGSDTEDGTQVKATGRYYNPWLVVPEAQPPAKYYSLEVVDLGLHAVDAERFGCNTPARGLHLWRVARAEMLRLARINANYNPKHLRDWYSNGIPHYCIHWSQVASACGTWQTQERTVVWEKAYENTPPPPERPDLFGADEAVARMRDMLRE